MSSLSASTMSLYVRVIGDTKQFEASMGQVSSSLGTVAKGLVGAFGIGFATREIARGLRDVMAVAAQLKDVAEGIEVDPENLQAIYEAGLQSGATAQKLDAALQRLQASQAAFVGGDTLMSEAFTTLGISEFEARVMSLDELLLKIGERLVGVKNNTAEYDAALNILGKRGMGNVINAARLMGENGMEPLLEGLRESGRLMESEVIGKVDRAEKALHRFRQWRRRLVGEVVAGVQDTLNPSDELKSLTERAKAMVPQVRKDWAGRKDLGVGAEIKIEQEAMRRVLAEDQAAIDAAAKADRDAAEAKAKEDILAKIKSDAAALDEQIMQARISDAEKLELIEQRIAGLKAKAAAEPDDVVRGRLENQIRQLELAGIPIKKAVDAQYEKDYEDQRRRGEQEERERGRADLARRAQAAERSAIERGEGVTVASPVAADRLAAIGGRVGLQTAMEANAVQRQIQISIQMRDYLKRIAETRIEPGVVA